MTIRLRLRLRGFRARPAQAVRGVSRGHRAKICLGAGLIAGLALFLGMGLAVETVKPEWRDPEYGHRLKQLRALHAAQPQRALVVALGSSRTQMGVRPGAMPFASSQTAPLVYNFGQSAAGPLRLLLTFQRLLDAGITPHAVLVELFPLALAADGPAEDQLRDLAPRLGHADFRRLESYFHDTTPLRQQWALARATSWHSLRLNLVSHWKPSWLPWQKRLNFQWEQLDDFGWTPFPIEAVSAEYRAAGIVRTRGEYETRLTHFTAGASSLRALRDLVERCRAKNIRVAFYLTPEGPAFRSWYSPQVRAAVDATVRELAQLAPVFDCADGFPEDAFSDGHHLLRGGAAQFSARMASEHIAGWLLK